MACNSPYFINHKYCWQNSANSRDKRCTAPWRRNFHQEKERKYPHIFSTFPIVNSANTFVILIWGGEKRQFLLTSNFVSHSLYHSYILYVLYLFTNVTLHVSDLCLFFNSIISLLILTTVPSSFISLIL